MKSFKKFFYDKDDNSVDIIPVKTRSKARTINTYLKSAQSNSLAKKRTTINPRPVPTMPKFSWD